MQKNICMSIDKGIITKSLAMLLFPVYYFNMFSICRFLIQYVFYYYLIINSLTGRLGTMWVESAVR